MNIPTDLKYTKSDEWVKVDGETATIGISDYAQDQLSDIVFVEIAVAPGEQVKKDSICATVESVKAAADVNLPVSGEVAEVNEALADTPEAVNSDPYGRAWMVKLVMSNPADINGLMDAAAYESYLKERGH